ncbi:MAG TPA: preprotein translocase subunit YajC [Acidimicrobiales bacterium]|nr:preprotein translocase subunit YajC [Acidimicrobiales bacterium]
MTPLAPLLLAATTTTTAGQAKSSGGGITFLLPLLLVAAVFIFMRRGRRTRQAAGTTKVGIGDRVQTAGGIRGTVVDMVDDEVLVEVAPGVVMTFVNRAVSAAPAPPAGAAGEPAPGDAPDSFDDTSFAQRGGSDDVPADPFAAPDDITRPAPDEGDAGGGGR